MYSLHELAHGQEPMFPTAARRDTHTLDQSRPTDGRERDTLGHEPSHPFNQTCVAGVRDWAYRLVHRGAR